MKRWAAAVALMLAVVAVAWLARVAEGQRAMIDCDAAIARGDAFDAIMAARAAAEARCPLCAAPDRGYGRLEAIARDAESRGEDANAFAAFRAIRAASLATDGPKRERADQEIARLGRRLAAARSAGAPPTAAAAEEKLRATLAMDDTPKPASFALLAAGGLCFFGAAVAFARSGRRLPELAVAAAGAFVAVAGILWF